MKLFCALFCWGLFALPLPAAEWRETRRTPVPAPAPLRFARLLVQAGEKEVALEVVAFPVEGVRFALLDNPGRTGRLGEAAAAAGALAAVNGGYFTPEDEPLGLRVARGGTLHPLQRARLLSGLFLSTGGHMGLLRPGELAPKPAVQEAVQAGPFLLEGGKVVPGLNASAADTRTLVVLGTEKQGAFVRARGVTLAQAAEILQMPGLLTPTNRGQRALNLDGGTSSGLWVAGAAGTGATYLPEWKHVRDFVALLPAGR